MTAHRTDPPPAVAGPRADGIDPRGARFAAAVTAAVLALVLVTGSVWLLAVQTLVFAVGAGRGPAASPYAVLFSRLLRPRLGPPAHREDPRPPRFAQTVGLGFAVLGLVGYLTGLSALALGATGLAFAAAFLNAAFGLCLGCEAYLIIRRTRPWGSKEIPA